MMGCAVLLIVNASFMVIFVQLWNEELLEHVQILTAGAVAVAVLGTTVLRASIMQCFATL
jgi:hypothetical protein